MFTTALENADAAALPSAGIHTLSRRGTCSSSSTDTITYNVTQHVWGLFVILGVSTGACAFPVLALRFPGLRIPSAFLFVARHFGTGVLIATAFCHLLQEAFASLGNACLPAFWNEKYPPTPGAIAMGAVFVVAVIEMLCSPARSCCLPDSVATAPEDAGQHARCAGGEGDVRDLSRLSGHQTSVGRQLASLETDVQLTSQVGNEDPTSRKYDEQESVTDVEEDGCLLLEGGIILHSIFIGMALSVTAGAEFGPLLVAISFHQAFEGLALGSRIATVGWSRTAAQPWLMAVAYGCTTPLGQAIGLATHTLYDPDSEVGLIVVGVANAVSAGLLLYASMVELLAEDFLSDASWRVLRGRRRVVACGLVFAGAFFMALLGAWAWA